VYFLAPVRTNLLVLGIDYTPVEHAIGRSDTIIMVTVLPLEPYVGALSVPRDLWVSIPGAGENRINTAHFFAEAEQAGMGPKASMETIRQNFGIEMDYYLRVRFDGFRSIVNAMGGVDIEIDKPIAGYPAGKHHLTGRKALAFARSRLGADDFFRMEQGKILIRAILKQLMQPKIWPRIPAVLLAAFQNVDTNIPWWQWPRLCLALLRAGPDGIDYRTIDRTMVTPFTTDQGASVLLPNWSYINPVVDGMFKE
jgi:LCP family protein required for cell wall assembly